MNLEDKVRVEEGGIDKLRRSTRVVGAVSSWSELLHGRRHKLALE